MTQFRRADDAVDSTHRRAFYWSTRNPITPSGNASRYTSAKWHASADLPMPPAPETPAMLLTFSPSCRAPFVLPQIDVPTFTGRSTELERLESILLHGRLVMWPWGMRTGPARRSPPRARGRCASPKAVSSDDYVVVKRL